jgi:hypothetical protein
MSKHGGSRHAPLRDVLAGLYNLEALLKSPRAANEIILGVLPELERGARTLLDAFDDLGADEGSVELSAYAKARVDAICEAIAEVPATLHPRARLTLLAKIVAARPELVLAVDLLQITEVSLAPEPTDLDLGEACRVAFASADRSAGPVPAVRVERASGSIVYDARILTFLLRASALAFAQSRSLVVAAVEESTDGTAVFSFAATGGIRAESMAPGQQTPSAAVFRGVLARFAGELVLGPPCVLRLPPMRR